uniref:Reverse transcriptase domain-containing protein n=1 Tax=Panagrolaimus sp. PS1159 TaxID=55785 RepID=A0AC35FQY2_9BILA
MGLSFFLFRVLFLFTCIISFKQCTEIFEVRENIFIRHDERIVNVLKRDHIQSQIFAFDATSFFANIPDEIGNITSEIIKLQAQGFAAKAVGQINGNIDYLFKQTCSTNHGTFA